MSSGELIVCHENPGLLYHKTGIGTLCRYLEAIQFRDQSLDALLAVNLDEALFLV